MPQQEVQQNATSRLNRMIDDITTLEVVTLSGDVTFADLKVDPGKPINFQKIMGELHGNPDMASSVKLVAATRFEMDKDVQQFIKEDMSPGEQKMFMIHMDAIQSAQQARQAIMDSLLNIIKGT